jgi:hypothetical protein
VFWDKRSLRDGQAWQQGFLEGLASSRVFVCLLSRAGMVSGVDHTDFSRLTAESACDNCLVELGLAAELASPCLGLLEAVYPLFLGDRQVDHRGDRREEEFVPFKFPVFKEVVVGQVETVIASFLEEAGLGRPALPDHSVARVWGEVIKHQGFVFTSDWDADLHEACGRIEKLVQDARQATAISTEELGVPSQTWYSSPHLFQTPVTTHRYRVMCEGRKVPVRSEPKLTAEVCGYVRHGEAIAVTSLVTDGFFEICGAQVPPPPNPPCS